MQFSSRPSGRVAVIGWWPVAPGHAPLHQLTAAACFVCWAVHVSVGRKSGKEARTMSAGALIVVKWSGKEFPMVDLREDDDVAALKAAIQAATGVRPERQKLLNLKAKGMRALSPHSLPLFCKSSTLTG